MCSMAMGDFCPGKMIQMIATLIAKIPDKKGGYVTVVSLEDGRMILQAQVGEPPVEKTGKYCQLSLEKAIRVYCSDEKSSWVTRDWDEERYGGGIRAGRYAIAFSGLSEKDDEAVVTITSKNLGLIGQQEVDAIAEISANERILALS